MLVENLRPRCGDRIETLAWMGPETKKAALRKLDAFGVKIGYPDKWRDYSGLEISRGSYFGNVVAANRFEVEAGRRQARQADRPDRVGDDARRRSTPTTTRR